MVAAPDGATSVRIEQARDDEFVYHYRVDVMDIPVPDAVAGNTYEAKVVAVDSYGNASPEVTLTFTR